MRKLLAFIAVACTFAVVFAQVRGIDLLKEHAKALYAAKSLSATVAVQPIGSTTTTYTVALAKPNKARVDTPYWLVVADGTTITRLDKSDNTFYKQPQTDADLQALFGPRELSLFAAFFNEKLFDAVPVARATGQKVRKGTNYTTVEVPNVDQNGSLTYYIDPSDKMAKVNEISTKIKDTTQITLVMAKELAVNKDPAADAWAFTPPAGARELTLEELTASKWYDDLGEAQAAAKRLNRPIFVDFYADW